MNGRTVLVRGKRIITMADLSSCIVACRFDRRRYRVADTGDVQISGKIEYYLTYVIESRVLVRLCAPIPRGIVGGVG